MLDRDRRDLSLSKLIALFCESEKRGCYTRGMSPGGSYSCPRLFERARFERLRSKGSRHEYQTQRTNAEPILGSARTLANPEDCSYLGHRKLATSPDYLFTFREMIAWRFTLISEP